MFGSFAVDVIVSVGLVALGAVVIIMWCRTSWRKIGPEIFPAAATGTASGMRSTKEAMRARDILRMARNWLSANSSSRSVRALAALTAFEATGQANETLDALSAQAMETDNVASLLVRTGDAWSYLLVFPDRYDRARAACRYPGFANGWEEHFATVQKTLAAQAASAELIGFLFFLDPDGGDSALLLCFADSDSVVVPAPLGSDRAGAADSADLAMEFQLAA